MQTNFGKRLAAVDKAERDNAVEALRTWLAAQKEVSMLDLLKLWKALFYCYWLSDKPAIQEELAANLSSIISSLPGTHGIDYLGAFWETMIKEWHGVDRHRLNKFYMLFRYMQYEAFRLLERVAWDDEYLTAYIETIIEGPLSSNPRVPDSIRYHTTEHFVDILESSVTENVPPEVFTQLMMPFIVLMAEAPSKIMYDRIRTEVYDKLMQIVDKEIASEEEGDKDSDSGEEGAAKEERPEAADGESVTGDDDDDDDDPDTVLKTSKLQIYFPEIVSIMFEIASHPETREANRKRMYELVKVIKARYNIRLEEEQDEDSDDEDDEDTIPTLVPEDNDNDVDGDTGVDVMDCVDSKDANRASSQESELSDVPTATPSPNLGKPSNDVPNGKPKAKSTKNVQWVNHNDVKVFRRVEATKHVAQSPLQKEAMIVPPPPAPRKVKRASKPKAAAKVPAQGRKANKPKVIAEAPAEGKKKRKGSAPQRAAKKNKTTK